jgi:hypothetical protein
MGRLSYYLFLIFCFYLNLGCNPRKTNASLPELSDSTSLSAVVDSANFLSQDGLDYLPLNTGSYEQLPQLLTELLNQKYAGWALPTIPAEHLGKAKNTAPGPYFLQADFNGDEVGDYAVLYQYQDSVTVAAYLQKKQGNPQEIILERQPLETGEGEKYSLLFLSQKKKGTTVYDAQINKKVKLPLNAIGVGNEQTAHLFLFNGRTFSRLNIGKS